MMTETFNKALLLGIVILAAVIGSAAFSPSPVDAQTTNGASAFCHETDGVFTTCTNGSAEWSDVAFNHFPDTNAFLYADQADLDPAVQSVHPVTGDVSDLDTFVLMYDQCALTEPLGPDGYVLVSFDTVEVENGVEKLERYVIHVFTDGTIIFFEDGQLQMDAQGDFRVAEIDGQRGHAGFGPSPTCPFDHVIGEFQIVLETAGGNSYSPDPIFWGGLVAVIPPQPQCAEGEIIVPLLVNVLKGVTISTGDIETVVSRTNTILDQAGICYEFNGGNIARNFSDQGNNNGDVESNEFNRLVTQCRQEVNSKFKGRGGKIVFSNTIFADPSIRGAAPTDGPVKPCVIVQAEGRSNGQRARTTAHESGHMFMRRGDAAHRNNDLSNLMSQSLPFPLNVLFSGTDLDAQQIQDMRAGATTRQKNTEHGGWSDDFGDVSSRHIDLVTGTLFAENLDSALDINISVDGLHPGSDVNSNFEVFFNTDNNVVTGTTSGSFSGSDKILDISLTGRFPFTSAVTGSMTTTLVDVVAGTSTPLPPGSVERIQLGIDGELGSFVSVPIADSVNQPVPLPLLGLSAPNVPIGIRATNLDTGEFDEVSFVFDLSVEAGLRTIRPGFDSNIVPRNDDDSTGLVPVGFTLNFFGTNIGNVFVNNNGNLTLDAPLGTFTPFDLTSTGRVIIAPFFGDVDTRSGNVVTYGQGTVNGRPAFGATWPGVGCFSFNTSVLNFFQVVLIDRSDVAPGDFDIEFNYDSIEWETGQASGGNVVCQGGASARVGFSNGTGNPGTFFELQGSGIPGSFLDSNVTTGLIHNNRNSNQLGQYIFPVRSGVPITAQDGDGDDIPDERDNCLGVPNTSQQDTDLNGIGDACQPVDLLNGTAAFLQARLDGGTSAEPTSGQAIVDDPSPLERLIRIVVFRVSEGLSNSPQTLTENLVNSLVEVGLVPAAEAQELVEDVLLQVNAPPDCSAATPSVETIWPPNHKFVPVHVLGVTDPDGDTLSNVIDSIFQDEPVDSTGDGNFSPDGKGIGTGVAEVRAERGSPGNGRVYHIGFTADDGRGGSCSGEVLVGVPHNQGKGNSPVDDGAIYDSTLQ